MLEGPSSLFLSPSRGILLVLSDSYIKQQLCQLALRTLHACMLLCLKPYIIYAFPTVSYHASKVKVIRTTPKQVLEKSITSWKIRVFKGVVCAEDVYTLL